MGGMKGKTTSISNIPRDVTTLRGDLAEWLKGTSNPGGIGAQAERDFETLWAKKLADYKKLLPSGMDDVTKRSMISAFEQGKEREREGYLRANPQGAYSSIFNNNTGTPYTAGQADRTQVADVARENPTTIGPAGRAAFTPVMSGEAMKTDPLKQAQTSTLRRDPQFQSIVDMITGKVSSGNLGATAQAGNAGSTVGMVQSMDQLAGQPNAYFKEQVLSPYKDLFKQNRSEALAAAREGSGNLTGSGYANALGTTVNRSLGEENKTLSDILTQLGTFEIGRQQQVADREQGRLVSNAGFDTQAAIASAGNKTQGNLAGLSSLSDLTRLFSNESLDAAKRADTISMFNSGELNKGMLDYASRSDAMKMFDTGQVNSSMTQQAMQNAQLETERAIAQGRISSEEGQNYYNQQVARTLRQAELDQQNNQFNTEQRNTGGMFERQLTNSNSNQNTQNFLQLLMSMTGGGVSGPTAAYQPGAWDAIAQILPWIGTAVGAYYGGRRSNG